MARSICLAIATAQCGAESNVDGRSHDRLLRRIVGAGPTQDSEAPGKRAGNGSGSPAIGLWSLGLQGVTMLAVDWTNPDSANAPDACADFDAHANVLQDANLRQTLASQGCCSRGRPAGR
jgi:hypothetical protein